MRATGMNCPVCAVPLAMSSREGVEIDYCPTCRGVWLDRGELDKIVARSGGDEESGGGYERREERSYRPDRSGHDHYGKPKRRKSFFEELFD